MKLFRERNEFVRHLSHPRRSVSNEQGKYSKIIFSEPVLKYKHIHVVLYYVFCLRLPYDEYINFPCLI